jgi:hypothetical protein
MPIAAPALEIASIAYSTWYRRPSGLNMVVRLSYLRAMLAKTAYVLLGSQSDQTAVGQDPTKSEGYADELSPVPVTLSGNTETLDKK